MFTGLIEAVGKIEGLTASSAGVELRISCPWDDLAEGESVAVGGACLTVLAHGENWFTVAAMAPTLERTAIGGWEPGTRVNLERAMRAGGRFGGHIVQGHVDGVGAVTSIARGADSLLVDIRLPEGLSEMVVPHGSIAIDGVSLTVNRLDGANLQVALIGYTQHHTALGDLRVGSRVHVETDVIGKYVRSMMGPYTNS